MPSCSGAVVAAAQAPPSCETAAETAAARGGVQRCPAMSTTAAIVVHRWLRLFQQDQCIQAEITDVSPPVHRWRR